MAYPGYRGVLTVFFDGMVSAMNPYPKPWKFRVRRILKGWDGPVFQPSLAKILIDGTANGQTDAAASYPQTDLQIHAMNPAHIIFECFTNRVWGRGLPRSAMDEASFTDVATALALEGFGLCLKWNRQDSIERFVQSVLDTIAGVAYTDRTTGLIKLALIRGDYTFASLPLFDVNNGVVAITEAASSAPSSQVTECIVTYHDPITDKDRKVRVHNVAATQYAGGANAISRSYPGIPTPALALRVAQRDLRAASSTLRRFTVTLDRRGWNLYPGQVIRIRDIERGIPDMAVRIGRFEDGNLGNGQIRITAVQDVFSMPSESYVTPQPGGWNPPASRPCIGRNRVIEIPYAAVVRSLSAADFNALTGDGAMFGTLLEEGQTVNTSYDVAVRSGLPTSDDNPPDNSYICGWSA